LAGTRSRSCLCITIGGPTTPTSSAVDGPRRAAASRAACPGPKPCQCRRGHHPGHAGVVLHWQYHWRPAEPASSAGAPPAPSSCRTPGGRGRKLRGALEAPRRPKMEFQALYCLCNIMHSMHTRPRAKTSHPTESIFGRGASGPSECIPPGPEPRNPFRARARSQ